MLLLIKPLRAKEKRGFHGFSWRRDCQMELRAETANLGELELIPKPLKDQTLTNQVLNNQQVAPPYQDNPRGSWAYGGSNLRPLYSLFLISLSYFEIYNEIFCYYSPHAVLYMYIAFFVFVVFTFNLSQSMFMEYYTTSLIMNLAIVYQNLSLPKHLYML